MGLIVIGLLALVLTHGTVAANQAPMPKEFDWRQVPNVVSRVKNQGDCDSSYAFATVGLLEGQQARNNLTASKTLVELSAQNIIDCSKHNYGCQGGAPATALDDLFELGGIESHNSYPPTISKGECKFNRTRSVMCPLNYLELPSGHEEIIRQKVTNYGPLAVRIEATEKLLHEYKSGVFSDTKCTGADVNHSVLIVGYGTDPVEGDYWLIKNSWGKHWGEDGYFRMRRGVNMCSIALYPTLTIFGSM